MCGRFKHCDIIDAQPGCPESAGARARARTAFHLVFELLNDPDKNFVPARKKSPQRKLTADKACKACGLSVYNTEQQAQATADYFKNGHPKSPIILGTHVAEGALTEEHGLSTDSDELGHYTFFECVGFVATDLFHVVAAVR